MGVGNRAVPLSVPIARPFAREALGFIVSPAMSARCVLSIRTTSAASAGRVADERSHDCSAAVELVDVPGEWDDAGPPVGRQ